LINKFGIMDSHGQKYWFELTVEEKESRLREALEEEMEKTKAMNLPVIYRNELCIKPNMFIHKYPNGHTVLIELDTSNSEIKVIKVLQQ